MMKKLLCIFALFMGQAFADEVKVEHYVEVSFPGEIWHNLDDDYYFRSPVNSSRCDSCFDLEKRDLGDYILYTAIDSNIFFIDGAEHIRSVSDLDFSFWVLSSATYSLSEAIRDQFLRFQECGYIVISRDSLNAMLDTAQYYIDSAFSHRSSFIYMHNCYTNRDNGPCIEGFGVYIGLESPPLYVPDLIKNEIARQNAAISAVPQKRPTAKDPLERYRLFDLNGRFIMNTNKVPYINSRMYYAR